MRFILGAALKKIAMRFSCCPGLQENQFEIYDSRMALLPCPPSSGIIVTSFAGLTSQATTRRSRSKAKPNMTPLSSCAYSANAPVALFKRAQGALHNV
jgi:hypothetical protein